MLTRKEFEKKVTGVRKLYGLIEEQQEQAILEGSYSFKVVFGMDDKEFILNIGAQLGFKVETCRVNDKIQFTFSC